MYSFFVPAERCGISDLEKTVDEIYSDERLRAGRDRAEIVEAVSFYDLVVSSLPFKKY